MRNRAVSWSLAGLTTLRVATALTLLGLDARQIDAGKIGFEAVLAVAIVLTPSGTGRSSTRPATSRPSRLPPC